MKYLDYTDKKYSKIGIGTGRFGTLVPEEQAWNLLDFYFDNGGTVIDTARNYYEWVENGRGKSEECIGRWLQNRNIRDKVCISTKGGVSNKGNNWTINLSKSNLMNELSQSLEALRTDYLDIYVLHRDETERKVEEIVETMHLLAEKGKIKHIGVSNWKYDRIKAANEYAEKNKLRRFEIIQTWWSLAEYKYEMWNDENTTHMTDDLYDYMMKNNMIGMAYTSMCKGFFQKFCNDGFDKIDPFLKQRIVTDRNLRKAEFIKEFCSKNNVSPTSFVLGYITSNCLPGIALFSTADIRHMEEIVNNCNYNLKEEFIKQIDSI